ncbi:MAG: DUF4116 domain-containing protein [bacterium]|nr:DUF4116 domain-containing protein [bacterium]
MEKLPKESKQYTPTEMAKLEKDRTLSDAEFLKEGAEYKVREGGKKELELTEDQIERIRGTEDRESVLRFIKEGKGISLRYISPKLRADKEVVLAAIKRYGLELEYASFELRADKEVVLRAVRENGFGWALKYASSELQADKEVVLEAVRTSGGNVTLQFASPKLRADKEVVLEAVKHNRNSLSYASSELQDDDEVRMAAGLKPKNFLEKNLKKLFE